jgi:hypothetical protein
VADIVAFVGHVVPDEGAYIDLSGKKCLSMLRSLGLPVTTGLLLVSGFFPSQYFSDEVLILCGSEINLCVIIFPSEYCRSSIIISCRICVQFF